MNEGERQALLRQVTVFIQATETKLRKLGLSTVKVGLYDEATRSPVNRPDEVIHLAEGYCMECKAGPTTDNGQPHTDECKFNPKYKEGNGLGHPKT